VHIRGVVQLELVNAPDWDLIQLVGLPFQPGEIAAPDYDPEPQGWPPALLTDGREFARFRLLTGQILPAQSCIAASRMVGAGSRQLAL